MTPVYLLHEMLIGSDNPLIVVDVVPAGLGNLKLKCQGLNFVGTQDGGAGPGRRFLYSFGVSGRMALPGPRPGPLLGAAGAALPRGVLQKAQTRKGFSCTSQMFFVAFCLWFDEAPSLSPVTGGLAKCLKPEP